MVWLLMGLLLAETLFGAMTITVNAAPEVKTPSYIVMEASTGQVICEQDADTRRSPASITKILTALIVVEQCERQDSSGRSGDNQRLREIHGWVAGVSGRR